MFVFLEGKKKDFQQEKICPFPSVDLQCERIKTENGSFALKDGLDFGWLFWGKRLFETIFLSVSSRLSETGIKQKVWCTQAKISKQAKSAPTANTVGLVLLLSKFKGHPLKHKLLLLLYCCFTSTVNI